MEIITYEEALERGLEKFYTGKPCKWGHVSERLVEPQRTCIDCANGVEKKLHPREVRTYMKQYNIDNDIGASKDEIRACANAYKRMLERASEKYWVKVPSYSGTTVCQEWKDKPESFFLWWLDNYNDLSDQVDKDILKRHTGEKHYSPANCMLVPHDINSTMWMYPKNLSFPEKKYMGAYSRKSYYSKRKGTTKYYFQANFHDAELNRVVSVSMPSEWECHVHWRYRKINRFIQLHKKHQQHYPKASEQMKCIALEMCIDASMNRATEWPH